ncbi:MAG: DUF1343 domain-containing protein [Bacteroidales bacterium]|nr:DUF1343 domain-containing protein [Bacteroidales bacterium]
MFSFRTTPIADQLDKAITEGRVGVFCTDACWDAASGRYLYDLFRERGNLARIWMPSGEEALPGTDHIDFDPEELRGLTAVVVEIQDTGARDFHYTVDVLRLMTALKSIPDAPSLYIVDHPNPAGRDVEGTLPAGTADEWVPAVTHRHGLTLGELCHLYAAEIGAGYPLHVISAETATTARTLLPWTIPPAGDFPGVFTPYFYTGAGLWTETNITPGLGTARPYEFIGAPFLKPDAAGLPLPDGVLARPCHFTPDAGPYAGERCWGFQFIILPGARYHSLLHTVRLMRHFSERYSAFHISEALYGRLADPVMSEYLQGSITFDIVEEHVKSEEQKWIRKARRFLLYDDAPVRIK